MNALPLPVQTFGRLVLSSAFMTLAWYGHLEHMAGKPWRVAALVSRLRCTFTSSRHRSDP
jgi:uncharacterized protein (DUF486 family)